MGHPDESIIEQLVSLKAAGAPIETSPEKLRVMSAHFRGGTPVLHAYRECRVGLRTLDIGADGTAKHCFLHPIGNLRTQSLRELWENPTRRKVIEKTLACEHARGKCGVSCTSYRTGAQELRRGLLFLKMGRQREMREVKCA